MDSGKRADDRNCVRSFLTYQWQPGKITTFVLPVVDIEMIVDKLANVADGLTGSDQLAIQQQIVNWQTVLAQYRSHNMNLTQILTADNQLFLSMLKSFSQFQAGGISETDFLTAFESFLGRSDPAGMDSAAGLFRSAFDGLSGLCSTGVQSAGNSYVRSSCDDFSSSKAGYKDLYSFLSAACEMPATPDADTGTAADDYLNPVPPYSPGSNANSDQVPQYNPLKKSAVMGQLCRRQKVVTSGLPGGPVADPDGSDELLGFLQSSTKYVTFGSNAPTTLTWTSTVKASLSVGASLDAEENNVGGADAYTDLDAFGGAVHVSLAGKGGGGLRLTVGKSSHSSHNYERTVTINLGDGDLGTIGK